MKHAIAWGIVFAAGVLAGAMAGEIVHAQVERRRLPLCGTTPSGSALTRPSAMRKRATAQRNGASRRGEASEIVASSSIRCAMVYATTAWRQSEQSDRIIAAPSLRAHKGVAE
jgi:hypothetical protein